MKRYTDFFTVPEKYSPIMTREKINETPETWLDFYPHTEFEKFCSTLLAVLETGEKSVWMTGNYGTGKSNAALVVQKLFMDDEVRVRRWFEIEDGKGLTDRESFENNLFARRKEGTLVVFDYNAAGIGPNESFLVRLEKGVVAALRERNMTVPGKSNLDNVIERLWREETHFFKTRNSIQGELAYLHQDINVMQHLIDELNKEHRDTDAPTQLLDDVQRVFHEDNIFLDVDVPMFRAWVADICKSNNLERVVYIFDEFHQFMEKNKEHLKTFEEVTESPGINRFYLVPVTHMEITSYLAENSDSARRANDRFYFRDIKMPNDTAFFLAHRAMVENPDESENWKYVRDNILWTAISSVVDKFDDRDVKRDSFYGILPIHPMAGFLLKFLSESAKSNQRSLFEYLKGSADGKEFQDFIRSGGPEVENKQFLTVDYLWDYFINRKDLGLNKDIAEVGLIYRQIRNREFSNQTDDAAELRVLKAVLLFCLLDRFYPAGHDRLKPTVENIALSFKGDGIITDPAEIVKDLASRHCFSIVSGQIELYTSSIGGPELQLKIAELEPKFHDLLSSKVKEMLEEHTKSARQYGSGRFDIRVSDERHSTLTNITSSIRNKYGEGQNSDNASVCLWFIIAKNKEEQLLIPERIHNILTQLYNHRILMFTFPSLQFCHNNADLWDEYVLQHAKYQLENDSVAKDQLKLSYERLEKEWFDELKKHTAEIKVSVIENGNIETTDTSWNELKELISTYVRKTIPYCVDYLTQQITAFAPTGLKSWALAGLGFNAMSGQQGQLVRAFKTQGISSEDDWFLHNSNHPLAEIRALFERKIANTVAKGGKLSIRKVYIELQRHPFGMRYNALSAFVLGFALSIVIKRNYQWTDERQTKPLDAETLAEIIEAVVKNDGNENMRGEKYVCRLSKEDKEFIAKAPLMFNLQPLPDATIESVLLQIQSHLENISHRVPLWVLPEYVRAVGDENADSIESVLHSLCIASTTSSKGKTEERSNAVKDIGETILREPSIISGVASYVKSENFLRAFELYLDSSNPKLYQIALEAGDATKQYSNAILEKAAETAGWLWKQADISNEIDEIICEYEVILLAKPLLKLTEFVPYKKVISALRTAITQTNRLPKQMIETAYPVLSEFLTALQISDKVNVIKSALSQNFDIIERLFFDVSKTEALKTLKTQLRDDISINDEDLLDIMNSTSTDFSTNESMFLNDIDARIEEYLKNSVAQKIKKEWERLTGSKTPLEWAINNKIPVRLIFADNPATSDIIKSIEMPEIFAASRLDELLEILSDISILSIEECQNEFLSEVIPAKYAKFDIPYATLIDHLCKEYGTHPNKWPERVDISNLIKSQYKTTFAPQIVEKIRNKSPEELKERLLSLATEDEELGLLFWEV